MHKEKNQMKRTEEEQRQILWILLALFPFFHPGYVSVCVPWLDAIYNAGKVISALAVSVFCVKTFLRDRKISGAAVSLIAMELWMLANVLAHQGLQGRAIQGVASVLVVCAVIEIGTRRHAGAVVRAMLLLDEALIGIHFATMLAFPGGLYATPLQGMDNWFLGYRNSFIFYFAPALSLEFMAARSSGRMLRFDALLAVCAVCMAMGGSATGCICMLLLAALALTGLWKARGFHSVTLAGAGLAAFAAIVLLRLQGVFEPVFAFLGRKSTFSGRTGIWDRTMEAIAASPLVGYGMQKEEVRAQVSQLAGGITAHNFLLEQTYCFGLIGLLLLGVFLLFAVGTLYRHRGAMPSRALCLGLACFFAVMLMEGEINNVPMYSFLFLCCRADRLAIQIPKAAGSRERTPR